MHFGGLVFGALDGHADVAELVGDTREGLVDLGGRFGSRVGRLDGLFAGPERLDLGLQLLCGDGEFFFLLLQLRQLTLQVSDLLMQPATASQSLAGEILTTLRQRGSGLLFQRAFLLRQALKLQFDALAARGDVRYAPSDLLQQLQLLFIGVVEGFARIFGTVECLRCFRLEDQGEALPQTHGSLLCRGRQRIRIIDNSLGGHVHSGCPRPRRWRSAH